MVSGHLSRAGFQRNRMRVQKQTEEDQKEKGGWVDGSTVHFPSGTRQKKTRYFHRHFLVLEPPARCFLVSVSSWCVLSELYLASASPPPFYKIQKYHGNGKDVVKSHKYHGISHKYFV